MIVRHLFSVKMTAAIYGSEKEDTEKERENRDLSYKNLCLPSFLEQGKLKYKRKKKEKKRV